MSDDRKNRKRDYRNRDSSGFDNDKKRERSPSNRSGSEREQDRTKQQQNNGAGSQDRPADESESLAKKKISSRCRLFVGNLSNDMKDAELRELFEKHGEITECFLSSKGFAFVRMATRAQAEAAKENLDGMSIKGRSIRVRFAVHGASLKISELSAAVSNELLAQAFSLFGDVERAVHILDEKSQPTGEGIIEFERKPGALEALRRINEGVFLLTSNPRPVHAEPLEPKDEEDGLSERMVTKNPMVQNERSLAPRFALPGSFEHEYGNRWKELYRIERLRREQLEREFKEGREKLEGEMELAYQEYQAVQMREDLRRRQEELEHLEAERRQRLEAFRQREEERARARQQMQGQIPLSYYPGQQMKPSYGSQPPQFHQSMEVRANEMMRELRKDQPSQRIHEMDNRTKDTLRDMRKDQGPPAKRFMDQPPEQGGQRSSEQLVHGVQKLMQIMKQHGVPVQHGRIDINAQSSHPPPPPPPDVLSRPPPNVNASQFSDDKERAGANWQQPLLQERGRSSYFR